MNAIQAFPAWFKGLPHLFIALMLFFIILGVWLWTHDHDVFQMLSTIFGTVVGMLTGRALANPQPPPTDETVNIQVQRHTDPDRTLVNPPAEASDATPNS